MTSTTTWLPPSSGRAAVMGILNITPDSFSDGGQLYADGAPRWHGLYQRVAAMVEAGVDILDVGGESTRPGAAAVTTGEELSRVVPVVAWLKREFALPVSVDTSNPEVIAAASGEGADLINDVRALTRPGALAAAAASGLPVCLMHMPAEPDLMQNNPVYADVVAEVWDYLRQRVAACRDAGIDKGRIILDPGFGFGKTLDHNLALFRALPRLAAEGYPVLVGVSRKRMVGAIVGRDPGGRLVGSVALALLAAQRGAAIIRVHDVAETVDALKILTAVEGNQP